jgi:hypothetical protein
MARWFPLLTLLLVGCSNAPLAGTLDLVAPSRPSRLGLDPKLPPPNEASPPGRLQQPAPPPLEVVPPPAAINPVPRQPPLPSSSLPQPDPPPAPPYRPPIPPGT